MAGEPESSILAENERLLDENVQLWKEIKRLEREIELMEMSGFQPVRRTRHNLNKED